MTHSTLKSLGAIALALAMALPASAVPSASFPQHNEWTIAGQGNQRVAKARHAKSRLKSTVTDSDTKLGPTDYFGTLTGPNGESWYYTADYILTDPSNPWSFYAGVNLKIYDSTGDVIASINDTFELADNELGVNSVQLNPNVTQNFFNYDDKYEVMIFIHAVTSDYSGHCYNHVFAMENGASTPLLTIEGNQVQISNVATDSYSESYYMLFERDGYDSQYNYWLQYDVYSKATYYSGGKPTLVKTIDIDYDLVAESGNGAYPILMNASAGKLYFAMPHCEKPYFDPDIPYDQEPVVNEDNTFIIDLYDQDFELIKTTRIPMATKDGYLYSIPTMGLFRGQNDLDLDFFSTDGTPLYVITYEHYINSSDSFCDDIVVVDQDGNTVKTVCTEATGRKLLNDVRGYSSMYCFYNGNADAYHFVEVPSCQEVCSIPFALEDYTLSTSIDRVASKNGYQILSALTQGQVDEQENVIQKMAFFNPDGTFDHWEDLNLGPDVVMATVNISGAALSPYIFNTNDTREYMVIVKIPISDTSSATEDHIWIMDTEGNKLLDFGPDDAKGGKLLYVALSGSDVVDHKLFTVYYDTNYQYTLNLTNLPLESFTAGGDGTKANPYLISTVGDFMLIDAAPASHYALGAHIDFTGVEWNGLSNDFTGSLDGRGKVLSGIVLDGSTGIFSTVMGAATLKDFTVNKPTVTPGGSEAGIVAGRLTTDGTSQPVISNVAVYEPQVSGTFSGTFGGIVGQLVGGASVELSQVIGGYVYLNNATVGGILGSNPNNGGNVSACLVKDVYTAVQNWGGIAGQLNSGTVADCHVYSDAYATSTCGGIVAIVKAFMGARPTITRCVSEGNMYMNCQHGGTLYGGGIAGQVDEGSDDVITSCISAATIDLPATMYTAYVHRIAGYTSGDMPGEVNWEDPYWNDNPDYSNPDEWPRYPANPEQGIKDCYALAIEGFSVEDDSTTSVDGATITSDGLTPELLASLGYQKGTSVDAPWMAGEYTGIPVLYYENLPIALVAQEDVVYLSVDEEATLAFTVIGESAIDGSGYADSSDVAVVDVVGSVFDGSAVNVDIIAKGEGTAQVTASFHNVTAVTTVYVTLSGVKPIVAEAKVQLLYNGTEVISSDGPVSVYNLAGVEVARSTTGTVSVASLPSGVYIARSASSTLKFMR
ncbi:MAG: hypothetical protein LIO91_06240 [Bacteroidales bacterium]|nr:hypothetical protein [Bacteroidales bacterium]